MYLRHRKLLLTYMTAIVLLAACEGSLHERVKKVNNTVHQTQKAADEFTRATQAFAKTAEAYADTATHNKDSSRTWAD